MLKIKSSKYVIEKGYYLQDKREIVKIELEIDFDKMTFNINSNYSDNKFNFKNCTDLNRVETINLCIKEALEYVKTLDIFNTSC